MPVIIDSSAEIDGVRMREQGSNPASPAATHQIVFAKSNGLYIKDSAGAVTGPFGAGGTDVPTIALTLTNNSAVTVNLGDVVYLTDSAASAFDIDSNLGVIVRASNYMVGVVIDATIASAAAGKVAFFGLVGQVNLDASSGLGNYIYPKGSARQASLGEYPSNTDAVIGPLGGAFGQTLNSGTTPPAFIWNPPTQPTERLITQKTGLNMNSIANNDLFRVPDGPAGNIFCVVTRMVFRNASISLSTASWSLGFNSATYDNVLADATHTELTGTAVYTVAPAKNGATHGVSNDRLYLRVNTAQGAAATMDCDVYGYFLQ